MKPHVEKIKLTVDEYMELPNDGKRYQILDGELDVTPAPMPLHQAIIARLIVKLWPLVEKKKATILPAPVDVILDRHNVVQPDLVLVRAENASIIGEKNIQGVPDLFIEI